ncbi:MAG: hypothetical protein ABI806_30360 [Candidatus Solibacter sp.]
MKLLFLSKISKSRRISTALSFLAEAVKHAGTPLNPNSTKVELSVGGYPICCKANRPECPQFRYAKPMINGK